MGVIETTRIRLQKSVVYLCGAFGSAIEGLHGYTSDEDEIRHWLSDAAANVAEGNERHAGQGSFFTRAVDAGCCRTQYPTVFRVPTPTIRRSGFSTATRADGWCGTRNASGPSMARCAPTPPSCRWRSSVCWAAAGRRKGRRHGAGRRAAGVGAAVCGALHGSADEGGIAASHRSGGSLRYAAAAGVLAGAYGASRQGTPHSPAPVEASMAQGRRLGSRRRCGDPSVGRLPLVLA